jgi:hypothetical protein
LGSKGRAVAQRIATFDEPVGYPTLVSLLVGRGREFDRESELDQALSRLQDLGLMFWDQEQNTYAMHPVFAAPSGKRCSRQRPAGSHPEGVAFMAVSTLADCARQLVIRN